MENNQNTNQTSNNSQQNTNSEMPNDENLSTSKEENTSDISSDSLEKKDNLEENKEKPHSDEERNITEENNKNSNDNSQKLSEEKNIEPNTNSEKESDKADETKLDESLKEDTNSNNVSDSSNKEKDTNKAQNYLHKIIDYILEKNVFSKLFVIIFATIVFSYAYSHQESITRSALSYIGLILCVIVCYIEILGIRDHIWVIEGSIPTTKQWREAFFTPSTLRKHKIRKMIILLFAFLVFVGIYRLKCFINYREAISFLGIILMVTVVYYEILAVRDEIDLISKFLREKALEDKPKIEQKDPDESK